MELLERTFGISYGQGMLTNSQENQTNNSLTQPSNLSSIFSSLLGENNISGLTSMEISVMGTQPQLNQSDNLSSNESVVSHHNVYCNTKVYSKSYGENEAKDTCSICLAPIEEGEIVREINKCKHFLHINCADKWFEENIQCPICRQDIRVEIE